MKSKKVLTLFFFVLSCALLFGCSGTPYQVDVNEEISEGALIIAMDQQGKPYQWGGRGPDTFDCSGLITWSYKQAVGRDQIFRIGNFILDDATMNDLYNWNVTLLPLHSIKPGDILFFTSQEDQVTHGGLFIRWIDESTFEYIHASAYYGRVMVDTWTIDGKGTLWFVGAGRLEISTE